MHKRPRSLVIVLLLVISAALAAAPKACATASGMLTISMVGDCSIGDAYQYRTAGQSYHAALERHGYDWPFSLVTQYLQEDDLSLANLEAVLTTSRKPADKRYPLIAAPDHVNVLLAGGIDMVNTAGNHALDFGQKGYEQSMAVLEEAGIGRFGSLSFRAGNPNDKVALREVKGVRIGFVGYSYPSGSDAKHLIERISRLKQVDGCRLVIVSLHWGREEHKTPEIWQSAFAAQLMDAGADVIWGHHPHILQPIQLYQGKPVLYSTGNFTFGTMSSLDPDTGIFQLSYRVSGEVPVLEELRVIPCRTQGNPDFRPFELSGKGEREALFAKLRWKKEIRGFENLPESFLSSGIVRFAEGKSIH